MRCNWRFTHPNVDDPASILPFSRKFDFSHLNLKPNILAMKKATNILMAFAIGAGLLLASCGSASGPTLDCSSEENWNASVEQMMLSIEDDEVKQEELAAALMLVAVSAAMEDPDREMEELRCDLFDGKTADDIIRDAARLSEANSQTNDQITTSTKEDTTSKKEEPVDVNGTYTYSGSSVESTVLISGSSWTSEFCIMPPYCDVERDYGSIRDNRLYDSSGFMEVGRINVNGRTVTVSLSTANGEMTHRK